MDGRVDQDAYGEKRAPLKNDEALLKSQLHDAAIDELDVDPPLDLSQHMLKNAGRIWTTLGIDDRSRRPLQASLSASRQARPGRPVGSRESEDCRGEARGSGGEAGLPPPL